MSEAEKQRRQLQSARSVAERYDVTGRTIDRWIADKELAFPRPVVINNRRYFYTDELEIFERSRIAGQARAA